MNYICKPSKTPLWDLFSFVCLLNVYDFVSLLVCGGVCVCFVWSVLIHFSQRMTKPTKSHVRSEGEDWKCAVSFKNLIRLLWRMFTFSPVRSVFAVRSVLKLRTQVFFMRTAKTDQTVRMPRLICLRWAHMLFYRFCHALYHLRTLPDYYEESSPSHTQVNEKHSSRDADIVWSSYSSASEQPASVFQAWDCSHSI